MRTLTILVLLLVLPLATFSATPDNRLSLAGLSHAGVIFDVNIGSPELLLLRLQLVEETANGLVENGVTPEVVVSIRGAATLFMTKSDKYLPPDDLPHKQKIQAQARRLKALGYRLELCAVAVRLLKVDPVDIIDEVPLVDNGYISMIGYQNRGYAFVPMD